MSDAAIVPRAFRSIRRTAFVIAVTVSFTIPAVASVAPPAALAQVLATETVPLEGFGAATRGGADCPTVYVTNLDDSGAGSLREALSQGCRMVKFDDIAGTIRLASPVYVKGPDVTMTSGARTT
jgi:hypothetical protein